MSCLEEGKGVGECVAAIERSLPSALPSEERRARREELKKEMEKSRYVRFIESMTRKVGGISKGVVESAGNRTTLSPPQTSVEVALKEEAVADFTRKIRSLEQAAIKGDLNIASSRGGVWLNDLRSAKAPSESASVDIVAGSEGGAGNQAEGLPQRYVPSEVLRSHRGFRMKQLEIDEQFADEKEATIDLKIKELSKTLNLNQAKPPAAIHGGGPSSW